MNIQENRLNTFISEMSYSNSHYVNFVVPSYFLDDVSRYELDSRYKYQCFGQFSDSVAFVFLDNDINSNFTFIQYIRLYDDSHYTQTLINLSAISMSDLISTGREYVRKYCSLNIGANNQYLDSTLIVNQNNYDDLKNSKQPSEIIFSMLYIFIPVLLFVFALKVFKKGLFR